jgi:hypothetical protein
LLLLPERRPEPDEVAVGIDVRALVLAVVHVHRAYDRRTGLAPIIGETGSVIDVHVDRSWPPRDCVVLGLREMDREAVAMGEGVSLVVIGGREAEALVMRDRPGDIGDGEDRFDADDPHHLESVAPGALVYGCGSGTDELFPQSVAHRRVGFGGKVRMSREAASGFFPRMALSTRRPVVA